MLVSILSGVPGSGKSTWARNQPPQFTYVCSADEWRVDPDGVYRYKQDEIKKAHSWCLERFIDLCQEFQGSNAHIVVDNTNTSALAMAPYVDIANIYAEKLDIRVFQTSLRMSIKRNIHDVPPGTIRNMARQLDRLLNNWPNFFPQPHIEHT